MKNLYKINIIIFNDFGELVDTQLAFESLDEMSNKLSEPETMYKLVEQAREFATAENMLVEELEDNQLDSFEDLTPTSPLNNPANFI